MRFFKSTFFYRSLVCLIITFCFLLHTAERITIPLLNKVENIVYDLRLSLTTPNTIDDKIVIIDIDEKSLANEGRWPWSRDKLSYLVDILFDYYQIQLLGFDIVFAEPDTSSGLNLLETLQAKQLANDPQFKQIVDTIKPQLAFDTLFAKSIKDRPVVLGYYFNSNNNHINPNSSLPPPVTSINDLSTLDLISASGYGGNLAELQQATSSGGYFNNDTVDSDGSYRRLPLLMTYKDNIYETLSLAMYRRLHDMAPITLGYGQGYADQQRIESMTIDDLTIPVDQRAVALVPYRGKQGSFEYISITDILNAEVYPEQLEGKIVLMGTTAAGLLDLRTTPVQNVYPGVEVHANLLSAMLEHRFKSKPSYIQGAEFILLLIIALLVIVLYPRLSSISSIVVFGLLAAVLISANVYAWNTLNLDVMLATPLVLLLTLFAIQLFFGYFLETKKRNKLGRIFGQYIPAELVAEMSVSEHDFSLKGENKQMTVLFSDVRGFTSISETMAPEELCSLINEILTPVTHVIHSNHGTIDKYIGDAVMAFWGAPINDANHASNAVNAALAFKPVIESINAAFKQKDWPEIGMGIGINTGAMNVGNMGSEFRMAYTVMGDAVNLGSRLEGLTKQYGVTIIVSQSTRDAAPEFAYLELDRVRVKGKAEPITIYEPINLLSELSQREQLLIEQSQKALEFFYQQHWHQAKLMFEALQQQYPDKYLFSLFLTRISEYQLSPPPSTWDGVFDHVSK